MTKIRWRRIRRRGRELGKSREIEIVRMRLGGRNSTLSESRGGEVQKVLLVEGICGRIRLLFRQDFLMRVKDKGSVTRRKADTLQTGRKRIEKSEKEMKREIKER